MAIAPRARFALTLLVILSAIPLTTNCNRSSDGPAVAINVSVLIEPSRSSPQWFKDVHTVKGIDGYELLEQVVEGQLESEWFPEFRSHFVKKVLESAPEGNEFWGVFLWSERIDGWEPLPVGADLFSVKDGHVMAWALVEYDAKSPRLPESRP